MAKLNKKKAIRISDVEKIKPNVNVVTNENIIKTLPMVINTLGLGGVANSALGYGCTAVRYMCGTSQSSLCKTLKNTCSSFGYKNQEAPSIVDSVNLAVNSVQALRNGTDQNKFAHSLLDQPVKGMNPFIQNDIVSKEYYKASAGRRRRRERRRRRR